MDTLVCPKQDLSCLVEQGKPQGFCGGDSGVRVCVCVCPRVCVCVFAASFDLCERWTTWSSVCTNVWRQRHRVRDGPPSHFCDSQRLSHTYTHTDTHTQIHTQRATNFHCLHINQMRQRSLHRPKKQPDIHSRPFLRCLCSEHTRSFSITMSAPGSFC